MLHATPPCRRGGSSLDTKKGTTAREELVRAVAARYAERYRRCGWPCVQALGGYYADDLRLLGLWGLLPSVAAAHAAAAAAGSNNASRADAELPTTQLMLPQ
jgi:hypothetical protein